MLIKTCFYLKIAENCIFKHSLLVVFFLGIFCKLVFCKLQKMRWPSNCNCNCRHLVKMAEVTSNICGTHWHGVTKRALLLSKKPPRKNDTLHKWRLTTTLLAFWSTTNTLLIEPTPTIRHRRVIGISLWGGKNLTLKSYYHDSESYNKFKNFFLKITQLNPWHYFASCAIFVRHHFLWLSYLSISGRVFVMCHFYEVPLFSNGIKGCHFC